jgi:hypothetical protein
MEVLRSRLRLHSTTASIVGSPQGREPIRAQVSLPAVILSRRGNAPARNLDMSAALTRRSTHKEGRASEMASSQRAQSGAGRIGICSPDASLGAPGNPDEPCGDYET